MKNKWLVVAAIVIIVLLIGAGLYLMKSAKTAPAQKVANTQTAKPQTTNSLKGTIIGLLSGGKNVNCQVTYPDNKGTGSVYVSDKKFAGDFTMKGTDGKETTGHMISDGTYMYIWSSGMPTGIKMSIEAAKNAAANTQTNQSVNINQEVSLNCNPWAPDASKFTLPSDIQFRDMSQLLQQVAPSKGTTVTPQTQTGSSPCDQITDPTAKAACANALQGKGY
jgi:hypothetical protein